MKKVLLSLMAAGLLVASVATFVMAAPGGVTNPATLEELAQARQATQQYQNAELPTADGMADGYVQVSPYVPGMGYHYVNFALLDGTFDVAAPEILLYADAGSGRRLIGVEYVVIGPPPAGFTGDDDEWEIHPASCHYEDGHEYEEPNPAACDRFSPDGAPFALWHPAMWTLHVWLWQGNPDGIFAPFNPSSLSE